MQTSRRSILKGSILASLAGTMGATAMSASAAEKQAALPKKEYDLVILRFRYRWYRHRHPRSSGRLETGYSRKDEFCFG